MKRSWIGLGLLLCLLAAAALSAWAMTTLHEDLGPTLRRAGEAALLDHWQEADHAAAQAADIWQRYRLLRACFCDHSPLEEIDAGFSMLETYRRLRDIPAFTALTRELSQKTMAISQAHSLTWENFL